MHIVGIEIIWINPPSYFTAYYGQLQMQHILDWFKHINFHSVLFFLTGWPRFYRHKSAEALPWLSVPVLSHSGSVGVYLLMSR